MITFHLSRFTPHASRFTFHVSRIACCLWLTACATASPMSTRTLAPTINQPVSLTLWHSYTDASATLLQMLINDFHKTFPTITVRVETKVNETELLKQGLAALALNQTPDMVIADRRILAEFARRGALIPLDNWVNDSQHGLREDERADFFPGILETGHFPELGNQTWAFPFDYRAVVLYYNAEVLQAARVSVPRTWEQFSEAARLTTRDHRRGWVMSPNALVFYAWLFSRNGNVLNDAQTQAQFADEAGVKSLQLVVALTQSGAAYLADSDAHARAEFVQGKATFWFSDTDELARLAQAATPPSLKWAVTNIPQNDPTHSVTAQHGASIAIFRGSDARVRAAWLLTRWLTAPEQSARWTQTTLRVPVRLSAYARLTTPLPPAFARWREGFGDALPTLRAIPTVRDAAQIDATMVTLWTNVAKGADPKSELGNAAARVNRLLGNIP
jgi:ABC-type glycerol-3-phosphate transport system substrate-binding protein